MNFDSSWYSALNVLEYFFWFKSRLHYHARIGAIPLGGNTVFFDRELLKSVGGWDELNLTEDADIGLRLSSTGERIRVVYDDRYVTKEETPPTLGQFIRQRTRWGQGFIQTLRKGTWKRLPTRRQRWLAFYTLAFPRARPCSALYFLFSLVTMFSLKVPVLVALISYLPVFMLVASFLVSVIGLHEFTGAHGLKVSPGATWSGWRSRGFPTSWCSAYAAAARGGDARCAASATGRRTQHVGAHRGALPARPAEPDEEISDVPHEPAPRRGPGAGVR